MRGYEVAGGCGLMRGYEVAGGCGLMRWLTFSCIWLLPEDTLSFRHIGLVQTLCDV